jgi:hypothetical protein
LELILRGGINSLYAEDKDGAAGVTLGGGLSLKKISIDYAWVPMAELGGTHFFTLALRGFQP